MIQFWKDDCKIIFDEGWKLKYRYRFVMLLSVDSDLALSAIMLATSNFFLILIVLIWSSFDDSDNLQNIRNVFIYYFYLLMLFLNILVTILF